jgi:hypothetical protein
MSVILDSMRTLILMQQKEKKSIQDYTKQFQVTKEVCEAHISSPIIMTKVPVIIQRISHQSN